MGEFSIWHMIILLGVVLIIFGPSRLPGLGNSLGKAIRGFKDGIKGIDDQPTNTTTQREALPHQDPHSMLPPANTVTHEPTTASEQKPEPQART